MKKMKKQALGYCPECKENVPLKPAAETYGMLCAICGSNKVTKEKTA